VDLRERPTSTSPVSRRHPWEIARATFLLDALVRSGALGTPGGVAQILDVGSGDAYVARQLLARAAVAITCWDRHFSDADLRVLADTPGLTPVREVPDGRFDAALLLDVIEHVDDDVGFLRDVVARLRPGGVVLVSVPAWPALFSAHDVALHHHRRYTPDACRATLQRAGLDVVTSGGFFHALLAPRGVAVMREKLLGRRAPHDAGLGRWSHGPLVTDVVVRVLRAEQRLSDAWARRGVDVPGLSFFAVCRVPAGGTG
jgi:SAM-dependent methyltransferase